MLSLHHHVVPLLDILGQFGKDLHHDINFLLFDGLRASDVDLICVGDGTQNQQYFNIDINNELINLDRNGILPASSYHHKFHKRFAILSSYDFISAIKEFDEVTYFVVLFDLVGFLIA